MHAAIFTIQIMHAAIICDAISPEEGDEEHFGRSQGFCTLHDEDTLELSIQASDLPAFRAALNSWLRLIQVASEMIDRTQI